MTMHTNQSNKNLVSVTHFDKTKMQLMLCSGEPVTLRKDTFWPAGEVTDNPLTKRSSDKAYLDTSFADKHQLQKMNQ